MTTKSSKAALLKTLKGPVISDRQKAIETAALTAALIIERDKLQADRNEAVEETNLPYAVALDEINARIKTHERSLLTWARKFRETIFGKAKTILLAGHKLAFRDSTGKLGTAEGYTEADLIEAIINHEDDALAERFITIKPTLDKNSILPVLRAGGELAKRLTEMGAVLVREEKLTFEPDLDSAPAAETITT